MKIKFNEDKEYTEKIRQAVLKKGGYCPCRLQKTEQNYCMCEEFRLQIADENFEGFCHCKLYYKEK